ncbi:MAG: glycoside hydrolase family 105 protein [Puniceicoccaceae bacterium]
MKKSQMITLAALLMSGAVATAQLQVRNSVGEGTPRLLVDGLIETSWTATSAGQTAGFLLGDPMTTESLVAASDNPGHGRFRLLGSMNYRDWTLLGEGQGVDAETVEELVTFTPEQVQYLRFVNLDGGPIAWELLTGLQADVEAQLAGMQPVDWGDITDPLVIQGMLELAFDWQVANETDRQDGTGWVNGAFYTGVSAMYATTGLDKYRQAILDKGAFANWTLRLRTSGKRFYHADDHCLGQSWVDLYLLEDNPSPVWISDVKARLDQVMADPLAGRVDMNWCDALYMSPPLYGRIAEITGDSTYQTFIDNQWWDTTDFLYDTDFHLFYRDSSYFDDREPNGKPVFWSRGNGWVIGGLVRMLQFMPQDWPKRGDYIVLLEEMSAALAAIQGNDGLWSSSLLYPEKYDMERETSGSAFFTYAMAWGVNEGILDAATYSPVIEKAWAALTNMLTNQGTILFIQQVGAGPALNNGELFDKDYGYGAFLLAGTEMMRYYSQPDPVFATLKYRLPDTGAPAFTANATDWTLVDNFESGFTWTERKDVSYSAATVPDPHASGGSQVLSIYTGDRTPGLYQATVTVPTIGEGSVATVYQRFSYNNPEADFVFGISDAGIVDNYNDYESGFRVYFGINQAEARDGGSYVPIGDDLLQLETWYEVWKVIDNAADTYDIYIRGGSNYPVQTLLKSGIKFRNGTSSAITTYAVSYNTDYCEGTLFMDDLYVDTSGVNLTRPQGVQQPVYSPWSDTGRLQSSGMKTTAAGALWDDHFPWIYHAELGSWCYVLPQEVYAGGYYGWNLQDGSWIWFPENSFGLYFDYSQNAWRPFEN